MGKPWLKEKREREKSEGNLKKKPKKRRPKILGWNFRQTKRKGGPPRKGNQEKSPGERGPEKKGGVWVGGGGSKDTS